MISYAPFEVEEPQVKSIPQQQKEVVSAQVPSVNKIGHEGTECNYLIFVFIIGVLYIISSE